MREPYPDDLSDKEWEQIEPILEKVKKLKGHPPIHKRLCRHPLKLPVSDYQTRSFALSTYRGPGFYISIVRIATLANHPRDSKRVLTFSTYLFRNSFCPLLLIAVSTNVFIWSLLRMRTDSTNLYHNHLVFRRLYLIIYLPTRLITSNTSV